MFTRVRDIVYMDQLSLVKKCARCKQSKLLREFPLRRRNGYSRNAYCFPCKLAYQRENYHKYSENHQRLVHRNSKRYRSRNRELITAYLLAHPCVDCGESDLRVLEFDHVRPDKVSSVSRLAAQAVRWERVLAEMEKCEVRCANCHRRKTAKQFGWEAGLELRIREVKSHYGR